MEPEDEAHLEASGFAGLHCGKEHAELGVEEIVRFVVGFPEGTSLPFAFFFTVTLNLPCQGRLMFSYAELADVRGELRTMRQMLTLSLMQQQSATERLRGVSWTAQIDQPGNDIVAALLDTLLHDPNVNVRLAAVDALRRVSERTDVRAGITRAVADKSAPLLQVAVIDYLVETRDPQAPALLRQLTQDTSLDAAVRGRAEWALTRLS